MAKKEKKDKRFEITEKEGALTYSAFVIVDRSTGVNYLYVGSGYSGGLTPLLDAEGKPIVTPIIK